MVYADAAHFLYSEGYDPMNQLYTTGDFFTMWSLLTGEESVDFTFTMESNPDFKEQGNQYRFLINTPFEVVCNKCNSIVYTTPYNMLDNYIKHQTWCSNCIAEDVRIRKERLHESAMVAADRSWSNNMNVAKNYKLVRVRDEHGRDTGRVTMVKRTQQEIYDYEINRQTKGSLRRNLEKYGNDTGIVNNSEDLGYGSSGSIKKTL